MAVKFVKTMEQFGGGKVGIETGPNGGKVLKVTEPSGHGAQITLTAEEVTALKAEL